MSPLIQGLNPYTLEALLSGGSRVLWTPFAGSSVPTKPADIFGQVGPNYAATSPWTDMGAAKGGEGTDYTRGLESEGYEIEQVTGDVYEDITDQPRTIDLSIAEVTPEHVQMVEQAPAIATVAAASGYAASKRVDFGSISGLTTYRLAVVGRRAKGIGSDITEPGGGVRGSFVAFVFYKAVVGPKDSGITLKKGEMADLKLQVKAQPDPTQPQGKEFGCWMIETAPATIA